ncbi:hypothetical protein U1Q18_015174, partial [Sarracenia purpurea var. burkii]
VSGAAAYASADHSLTHNPLLLPLCAGTTNLAIPHPRNSAMLLLFSRSHIKSISSH